MWDEDDMEQYHEEDTYHFSIPFEYIIQSERHGDEIIGTATMEVDLEWDEEDGGYRASYYSPDESLIDPDEGNGSIDDFYNDYVEDEVAEHLDALGVVSFYALIRV